MRLSRDGWTGLVVLAASLVLFVLTLDLKPSPFVPVGPGFYPRIVLGISALFAAMLVAQDFVSASAKPRLPEGNYRLVFLIFAIFGVYVVALPWLGYRIATFFFCVTLQARLDPPASPRKWAIVVGAALATTFVTYYLFEGYLQVLLPRGRWTAF